MSMDPQMLAAMLMQQGQQQPQQQGALTPKMGAGAGIAQGGNDFLKMMMMRQMMQQKPQMPQAPPVPQMPQNTAPMMPQE